MFILKYKIIWNESIRTVKNIIFYLGVKRM